MARLILWLKVGSLVVFSVGWILPLFLAVNCWLHWGRAEVEPRIYGNHNVVNSFPYLRFAQQMGDLALAWIGVAALFWSAIGSWRLIAQKKSN